MNKSPVLLLIAAVAGAVRSAGVDLRSADADSSTPAQKVIDVDKEKQQKLFDQLYSNRIDPWNWGNTNSVLFPASSLGDHHVLNGIACTLVEESGLADCVMECAQKSLVQGRLDEARELMTKKGVRLNEKQLDVLLEKLVETDGINGGEGVVFREYLIAAKEYDFLVKALSKTESSRLHKIYNEMATAAFKKEYVKALMSNEKEGPKLLQHLMNSQSHYALFFNAVDDLSSKKDLILKLFEHKNYQALNKIFEMMDGEARTNCKEALQDKMRCIPDEAHNFESLRLHHYVFGCAHSREKELVRSSASYLGAFWALVAGQPEPAPEARHP